MWMAPTAGLVVRGHGVLTLVALGSESRGGAPVAPEPVVESKTRPEAMYGQGYSIPRLRVMTHPQAPMRLGGFELDGPPSRLAELSCSVSY